MDTSASHHTLSKYLQPIEKEAKHLLYLLLPHFSFFVNSDILYVFDPINPELNLLNCLLEHYILTIVIVNNKIANILHNRARGMENVGSQPIFSRIILRS